MSDNLGVGTYVALCIKLKIKQPFLHDKELTLFGVIGE